MADSFDYVPPTPLSDQVQDSSTLLEALEKRLSKAQYDSLVHCQNVLRESRERRLHPERHEPPAPRGSVAAFVTPALREASVASVVSVPHSVGGGMDWWTQATAKNVERALAQGLTRTEEAGVWFCPHCDKEVAEHHLEPHMDSNKHQRYKAWHDQKISNEQRQARGELPDWMTVVDGNEFCTICDTLATEAHLYSQRHQKALAWHQTSGSTNQYTPGFWDVGEQALMPMVSAQHPIPANWGDPSHFEWKAEAGRYFCRLCWKYADDAHISSEKHTVREQNPAMYLGTDGCSDYGYGASFGLGAGAPPPPPPPGPPTAPPWISAADAAPPVAPRLALCLPACEAHRTQALGSAMPSRGGTNLIVTATGSTAPPLPPQTESPSTQNNVSASQTHAPKWQRFAADEKQESFWWWCEANGESFLEDTPGHWTRYEDPSSRKSYWWSDNEKWFWVHSGSTSL